MSTLRTFVRSIIAEMGGRPDPRGNVARMALQDVAEQLGARWDESGVTLGPFGKRSFSIRPGLGRGYFTLTLDTGYGDVEEGTVPADDEIDLAERAVSWLARVGIKKGRG